MFPVWPLIIRKILVYIISHFLMLLMGYMFFRYIVYILFRGFGWSVWLTPKIFMEDEIFPLITCERNPGKSAAEIVMRLIFLLFICFMAYSVYKEPETIGSVIFTYFIACYSYLYVTYISIYMFRKDRQPSKSDKYHVYDLYSLIIFRILANGVISKKSNPQYLCFLFI